MAKIRDRGRVMGVKVCGCGRVMVVCFISEVMDLHIAHEYKN